MKLKLDGLTTLAFLIIAVSGASGPSAHAAPTKLGNGDDGRDLEGATPLTDGPIVEARGKAIELLRKLGTEGVSGLGLLIPELETSKLYLAQSDVGATLPEDQGKFHSDMRGQTYARTFATPHAVTRFFPAATKLSQDQLIALEIHEALHRSLPASIRENESVVAELTLAITSPGATHDQIVATSSKWVPVAVATTPVAGPAGSASPGTAEQPIGSTQGTVEPGETARINHPSLLGYTYRSYQDPQRQSQFPVSSMHVLESDLYPFGNSRFATGFGIQASLIDLPDGIQSGPLSLSARTRLWSGRGFDVGIWGVASLNTLSTDELKSSPFGRDVYTVGVSVRKDLQAFYVEDFLSYSAPGTSTQTLGQVASTYDYGGVTNASMHAGVALSKLKIGGYAEINLADYFRFETPAFNFDSGRYRIVSAGPEVTWLDRDFAVTVAGKFLLNATQDANFDYLGNIMGAGVAQGYVSASLSVFF